MAMKKKGVGNKARKVKKAKTGKLAKQAKKTLASRPILARKQGRTTKPQPKDKKPQKALSIPKPAFSNLKKESSTKLDEINKKLDKLLSEYDELLQEEKKIEKKEDKLEEEQERFEKLEEAELEKEYALEKIEKREEERMDHLEKIEEGELDELKKLEALEAKIKKEVEPHPLAKISVKDFFKGSVGAFIGLVVHFSFFYVFKIAESISMAKATFLLILSYLIGAGIMYATGFRKVTEPKLLVFWPLRATIIYLTALLMSIIVLFIFGKDFGMSFSASYAQVSVAMVSAIIGATTADLIGRE